ncbi:MAG: cation diffusion facilitator family transporter [Proteobacteria bacterium]|nr:cation diffusion facilitator family transporter [Pseudomonadota bacterium]
MNQKDRFLQAKKITLIGAFINALLGVAKIAGGLIFHSHALIADGVHSFSDLITDFTVLFASKYGNQDADDSHPYGHQRIETAATLLLAVLLIIAGTGISWDALDEMINQQVTSPNSLALIVVFISIFANEILFHYTYYVGKKIQSSLIIANAWHHRSDALASIVVAIGLFGSIVGFHYLDTIAAIIVGCLIIKMGIDYGWNSVKELVDTAIPPETLATIEKLISEVDGVKKIHQLRSRSMGSDVLIDVHILVKPFISVSEGHYIAQHVEEKLIKQLDYVKDVTVHVDPEDDELECPSLGLPTRKIIEELYLYPWKKEYPLLEDWTLHYLDGKMSFDLIISPKDKSQIDAFVQRINQDLTAIPTQQIRLLTSTEVEG